MRREKKVDKRARAARILRVLERSYPNGRCSLEHASPFQLLVATVLSAQCTDARVNAVTPALFRRFPTPEALASAPYETVEDTIRSVNFFRTKSRALIGLAQALVERFGGKVPMEIDELTSLPGVGRKTANVVRGVAFGLADGVVVDTHVKRIARRLGLTGASDPFLVEQDLLALIPPEDRVAFTHRVIDHGRAVCIARTPRCAICALAAECPSARFVELAAAHSARPDGISDD